MSQQIQIQSGTKKGADRHQEFWEAQEAPGDTKQEQEIIGTKTP